ncbi:hypothetical protein [Brevundimonas faecalis]|uniref:Membrane protein n=1 Tax=Brevundimonas faecalis TaxID=947378 RepID=A0ABV2RFE4_9CAUL
MKAPPSRPMTPHIAFKAAGVGLLVLSLAFLLFALGFFVEGLLDRADGRMDGHAALNLSEAVAMDLFRRRIWTMLGFSAALLVFSLGCFRTACVLRPKS